MSQEKHLAIYNLPTHEVEYIESYPVDAREYVKNLKHGYDDEGKPQEWEEKVDEVLLWELRKRALGLECVGRGLLNGEWKVYTGDVPFTWEAVTPPEVVNA